MIIRELLMGGTRFSELQRGLCAISPTLLTKRLHSLEDNGLLYKKKISGQRGYEYFPTEPTKELLPILISLGDWGMQWAKNYLTEEDYDVELLMLYLERSIVPDKLPGGEKIIKFKFLDISDNPDWWIIVNGLDIDICVKDPCKDVDVYFTSTVKTLTNVWLGHMTYKDVIKSNSLAVVGPKALTGNIISWMSSAVFAKDLA